MLALALLGAPASQAQAASLKGKAEAGGRGLASAKVAVYASGPSRAKRLASTRAGRNGAFKLAFKRPRSSAAVIYAIASGGKVKAKPRQVRMLAVAGQADRLPKRLRINELTTVA